MWNSGTRSSTSFDVSHASGNSSGKTYVAYLWRSVEGYSKFGKYTGNGSADGPFVYTGFKPKFVLRKRTDSAHGWLMFDSARGSYNLTLGRLDANESLAEVATGNGIDILANGFKMRSADGDNTSGGTYIYAAFADMPFKYSAAPAASAASSFVPAIAFLMGMTF